MRVCFVSNKNLVHFTTNANGSAWNRWVCYNFQLFWYETSLNGVNELPILYRCQIVPVCIRYSSGILMTRPEIIRSFWIVILKVKEKKHRDDTKQAISLRDDVSRKRGRDFNLLIQVQIGHHTKREKYMKFALGNNCPHRSLWIWLNRCLLRRFHWHRHPLLFKFNVASLRFLNTQFTAHRNPFACPNMTFMSAMSTSYREASVRFQSSITLFTIIAIAVMKCGLIQTLCFCF